MAVVLKIHPENPPLRKLEKVVDTLRQGGVILYPTDTIYGLGCDITQKKAVQRVCQIKGMDMKKVHLTCVCEDVAIIGSYANHVTTPVFKLMRQALPGPYTFILEASKAIPRHFQHKKTVGIRVPDHSIPRELAKMLGNPIASLSVEMDPDDPVSYMDPSLLAEKYHHLVDIVIDGGFGEMTPSTVLDVSRGEDQIEVIREGAGSLEEIGIYLD